MKKSAVLMAMAVLLSVAPAWALDIQKSVEGPELIDLNESLAVVLTVSSVEPVAVEKLTDPVPAEFVAVGYPSSCHITEKALVCNIGQEFSGTSKISYKLVAISTGYGIIGGPSVAYGGGVKTTDFFRHYFVGKPRISIELEGSSTFLPEEEVVQTVVLANKGIRGVDSATVRVSADNYNYSESFPLNPEEVRRIALHLGAAPSEGSGTVTATVSWGNNSRTATKTLLFIAPGMDASRTVSVAWKLEDKKTVSFVKVVYRIKNNGTAPGNYSFSSGEQFTLSPGEAKTIEKEYAEAAPGEKISLRDSRGNIRETKVFVEEAPEARKGFFVLLFENVASSFPLWMLVAGGLVSLYFASKFKSNMMKLGLLGLSAVCWLMAGSYLAVGAVKMPAVISRML